MEDLFRLEERLEEATSYPVSMIPLLELPPASRLRITNKGEVLVEKPGLFEALLMETLDELELVERA